MPDDATLRLGIQVDGVGNVQAAMKSAADAVSGGARSIAAALIAQGESTQAAESALINLGYSEKEAAAVVAEFAPAASTVVGQADRAAASVTGLDRAMANAAVRIGAVEAGLGGMGTALGRVASQSETLGPILTAAFPVIGAVAFATILVDIAEKAFKAYQNIVLLKASIDALDKSAESEASHQAELNYQFDLSAARLLENSKDFAAAREAYQKAAGDKPIELLDLRKAVEAKESTDQFSESLRQVVQSANLMKDTPKVVDAIKAELAATETQLQNATKRTQELDQSIADVPAEAVGGLEIVEARSSALVTDLTKKADLLKGALAEIQSQTGITANSLKESELGIGKREAGDENKLAEAQRKAGEAAVKQEEENLLAMKAQRALTIGEEYEYWVTLAAAYEAGSLPYLNAVKHQQEIDAKLNEEEVRAQQASGARLLEARRAVNEAFIRDILKTAEEQKRQQEEAKAAADDQLNLALTTANRTLEYADRADNERLSHHQITLAKWQEEEEAALNAWYQAQTAAILKAEKEFEAAGLRETEAYAKLKNRQLELDQQYALKTQAINAKIEQQWQAVGQKMAQTFTQGVNAILTGNERIGQAALRLGQQLELYIIDQGIKKVVTTYGTELLKLLAAHSTFLAHLLGIQTAGAAAQIAQAKTTQAAEVTSNAGEAGAAGFASVMEALPFPANVATAPGVAASAAAQTLSFLAFEGGGIVPSTGPALLHAKEMVLPAHISNFIQSAASNPSVTNSTTNNSESRSSSSVTHFHRNNFELHVHGGNTDKNTVIEWVRQGIRQGSIGPNV